MNDIARIVPWWIALGLTGLGSWQSQAADRTDRQLEEAPDKVARSKQHLEATRRQVEQDHDSAPPLVAARRELADSKTALDAYGDRVMGIALGLTGLGSWQSQAADRTDRQLEEAQDKVARSKEHLEATRRRVEQDHDSAPPLVAARRELADSKTALDAYGDRVMAELRQRRDYQEALTRLHWFEKEFSRMQESGGKTADPVRLGDELSQAIMTEWRLKKVARGPAGEIAEQKVSKAERQLNELIRQRDEAVRKDPRLAQSTRELDAANSALAAALPRFDTLTNSIGMKLILIPNGEFLMGSPDSDRDSRDDEKPQHLVRITVPFYLGVYEVTQAEYEQIMGKNPSYFKGSTLPVGSVSWEDAVEFCQKLSVKEGQEYRLPTEAEWEYACRAGTTTPFSFGGVLNGEQANCDGNNPYGTETKGPDKGLTTPVGSYRANAFGLYDMHGNVCEWCADWYGSYEAGTVSDPSGPLAGLARVHRGGSWYDAARRCRSACRYRYETASRSSHLGFRVALNPSGK